MIRKELGKIEDVTFGRVCGRSEEALGLKLTFSGAGWGVGTDLIIATISDYDLVTRPYEPSTSHPGVYPLRDLVHREFTVELIKIMHDAKVRDITKLKGMPVEVTFDGMNLKSWRVLTEVL